MNEKRLPRVSVIIPHYRGKEILMRCLNGLKSTGFENLEIIVVDNGSTDGSCDDVAIQFPETRLLHSSTNKGYAGGCNLGLEQAAGTYALLLNDDALVTPGFLHPLVESMEKDASVASSQPKILSMPHPTQFDYAGAAGGYLDLFGYPFCRGRVFLTVEEDRGQYDTPSEIFWASGACCLLRMEAIRKTGFLDDDFFAHMEEIDLQWRLHQVGYKSVFVPASVVHHDAGSTLQQDSPLKVYLNHRNGLIMLIKNHKWGTLLQILPLRVLMDAAALLYRAFDGEFLNAFAVLKAYASVLVRFRQIIKKRSHLQSAPSYPDVRSFAGFYGRSIIWDYFVLKRRTFDRLPGI